MSKGDATHGVRGSQRLLEHLARNGDVPNGDEIKKSLQLPAAVKIPNWLVRGIPPVYLELDATIEVPIANLGDVVNRFVALNDSAINLNILINGIAIPDIAGRCSHASLYQEPPEGAGKIVRQHITECT